MSLRKNKEDWVIPVVAVEKVADELSLIEVQNGGEAILLQMCLDSICDMLAQYDVLDYDDMQCPKYHVM